MHFPLALSTLALAAGQASAAAANVWLCGDSTMAEGGGAQGTQGWGHYLQYSLNISSFVVRNKAVAGRSARSYTREKRFENIYNYTKPGDWVIIEFGHNDAGALTPSDNGKGDCPGEGNQTCQTTYNGVNETVLTYPTYYIDAANMFLGKGAKVIMSPPTPINICASGICDWTPTRFDYYAEYSAIMAGGTNKGVYYVPHAFYASQAMKALGPSVVNANYPFDLVHPYGFLSDVIAGAFVLGLKCGTSLLGSAVINSTDPNSYNETNPILGSCFPNIN